MGAQKRPYLVKHLHFWSFCPMPDQKTMWTRSLGGFSVMWITKLLISPVKKRIFCPKTTKFGPKSAFLVNLGQAMQAYSVPGLYLARHLFTFLLNQSHWLLSDNIRSWQNIWWGKISQFTTPSMTLVIMWSSSTARRCPCWVENGNTECTSTILAIQLPSRLFTSYSFLG